jgi:O-antigen ligase
LLVTIITDNNIKNQFVRTKAEINTYQKDGTATSAGLRISFWKYTLRKIEEHPVTGYGAGMYRKMYADYILEEKLINYEAGTHHPHNEFLFIWHDAGLVAVILYLLFIVFLYRQAFTAKNTNDKVMRLFIVTSLIIYASIDVPIFNSPEAIFFILMIAVYFDLSKRVKLNAKNEVC